MSEIPQCLSGAARVEGGPPGSHGREPGLRNLGATSDAYGELAGIDLTELVGATAGSGDKALMSTVRWCFIDEYCPFENAFWDGAQMVFGSGYAAADDVVAHELTHGFVERTSDLFYFHQSGAINESVSDVIGEIVDHRNPGPRRTTPPGSSVRTSRARATSAASRTRRSTDNRTGCAARRSRTPTSTTTVAPCTTTTASATRPPT